MRCLKNTWRKDFLRSLILLTGMKHFVNLVHSSVLNWYLQDHRIIESFRLEKISKIIKSNLSLPSLLLNQVTKPCGAPCFHVFWICPGMVTQLPPQAACSKAQQLFQWFFFFLISNQNLPCHNLRPAQI